MNLSRYSVVASLALLPLGACNVGPDYQRPPAIVSDHFKESEGWKIAEPRETHDKGPWWSLYNDPMLDKLVAQVEVSNQNLKSLEAAYRSSLAVIRQARASYFPTIGANGSVQQSGSGGGGGGSSRAGASSRGGGTTEYSLAGSLSWEIDLWGRISRTVEGNAANAQASAADFANAKLSAQSLLATNYFQLRAADEQKRILDATVQAFTRSLQITQNRYNVGTAARADVVQAQAQLESTRAQAVAVGIQRAQFEHAIAVLMGKPPADVTIAAAPFAYDVPVEPPGLPSELLERRPDIALAERRMAAANAQIGVAKAAYYPSLTLSASYGFVGTALDTLIRASNAAWSIGPQLAYTVFDGGARAAQTDQARANYDETVATYRQTVLTAFQQVEDQLAALRILAQQAEVQARAVKASDEAEQLVLNQYQAGTVAYTNVLTAQTTALQNRQGALSIAQNRLTASVALIEALGGGWHAGDLPDQEKLSSGEGDPSQKDAKSP